MFVVRAFVAMAARSKTLLLASGPIASASTAMRFATMALLSAFVANARACRACPIAFVKDHDEAVAGLFAAVTYVFAAVTYVFAAVTCVFATVTYVFAAVTYV